MSSIETKSQRPVLIWLCIVYLFILAMIVLGGVTRLTESGLSIVKWQPVTGVVPPLNDEQWQSRFADYKALTGQAELLFPNLTLEQFKPLFLWEYSHRLVGRLVGLVVGIPFLYFLIRRRLSKPLACKIAAAFVFGGLQGGVGWLMVATGLQKDATHVSPYALAAHLSLALILMSYIAWLILDLRPRPDSNRTPRWLRRSTVLFLALLAVQIVYGAFTAGFRAGHIYNTFPLMNGYWIPPGTFGGAILHDLVTSPVAIQLTHRTLGWVLAIIAFILWIVGRKYALAPESSTRLNLLVLLTLVQFGLGVATLLMNVPVALGAAHQLNAALLLTTTVALVHSFKPRAA